MKTQLEISENTLEMQIRNLSDEQLIRLKEKLEDDYSVYNNLQLAKKVTLNSCYGSLGTNYFRFFDVRQAEAITLSGQLAIQWLVEHINIFFNDFLETEGVDYVIAGDTDSCYLNLGGVAEKFLPGCEDKEEIRKFLDNFCEEKLNQIIENIFSEFYEYLNCYENRMSMKREVIADRGFWVAKKRYAINVLDSEGVRYQEPKVKVVGIESVRSSTPQICRDRIAKTIEIILQKSEKDVITFIDNFRKEFKNLPIEEIAIPITCNGLEKYSEGRAWKPRTPIHVRAAIVHNNLLIDRDLDKKYQLVREGEKIKFVHLRKPNPSKSDTIGFIDVLPKEFDLFKNIDYDRQFEKTYLKPIKTILGKVGWKHENSNSLFDIFGG